MITIALSFYYPIFLEDIKYMTILTRQEKERLVIELYNQGKTYREIAKMARISPRDIGVILNRVSEEKKTEGSKEEQQLEVKHLSLSTQSYKLFSEGKTPFEVAIYLNLRESEVTKFYREHWQLKQLHNLNVVYEEIKDDIGFFAKLYKLAKAKGMDVEQIVNLLKIANNDLSALEEQAKRQRREIGNLYNEKAILEAIVTEFKSNNEDYLKIKQVTEENVKNVLTNTKLFLKFAT